jgi:hypothetical protein
VTGLREPWVDPATIPELAEIIRRKWLSKVRIYEGWCESGDRLLQVVKVQGRPLALARAAARASTGSPNPAFRSGPHWDHQSYWQAAWLDLSWDAYYLPHDAPRRGQSVVLHPCLLSAECQHGSLSVPLEWLRLQLGAGASKRVITEAVRLEMGAPRRGNRQIHYAVEVRRPVRLVNLGHWPSPKRWGLQCPNLCSTK